MRLRQKVAVSDLEEALTRTRPCWQLDLRFPASRTLRNKFTPSMALCYRSPNRLGQGFWSPGLSHWNILGRRSQMVSQLECAANELRQWPGRGPHPPGQLGRTWAAGVASSKVPGQAARGSGVRWHAAWSCRRTHKSNAPHLLLHHLALDLGSRPRSLQLLLMDKGPVSCWRTLCSRCLEKDRVGGQGPRAGSTQPPASLTLDSSVAILGDMPLSHV